MSEKIMSCDLEIGAKVSLDIVGYTHDGRGVARLCGRVIFVDGAICGEKVLAEIYACRKKIFSARVVEIITRSAERTEPLCVAFGGCGGCHLQYMTYEEELRFKQGQVEAAVRRIGGLNSPVSPIIGADETYHYRNKGVFHIVQESCRSKLCFWDEGTHREAAACCTLLFPEAVAEITAWLSYYQIPQNVTDIMIRRSDYSGEMIVAAMLSDNNRAAAVRMLRELGADFGEAAVLATWAPSAWQIHSKASFITDKLGKTLYQIAPAAFFQVNNRQTEKLLDVAAELLGENVRVLIDAYCGIGTLGLNLAAKMPNLQQLIGIEVNESAVENARANAELNSIVGAKFYAGKAEELFGRVLPKGGADVVIVDPPRRGCHADLLRGLLDLGAPQILYVSCNPSTLARDLAVLREGGYAVDVVKPIDMFPRTKHVETVVKLVKKKPVNNIV